MTNKKSNTNATEILKKSDLVLLDNVQFIYELSLAELELSSLGIQYKTTNGLREFEILNKSIDTIELVKTKSSYFKTVDKFYTDYYHIIEKNTTSSINQYLTHWIYPYKGKFHPQMIRALINIIGLKEGDTLFEPFSGSGTTALEAQLLGVNLIGIDVSPLCVIQGKVKTQSIFAFDEILSLKGKVTDSISTNLFSIEKNYYEMLDDLTENETAKDFYKLARLVAVSDNSRRNRNFSTSFVKNLDLMIKSVKFYLEIKDKLELNLGNISINIGDARNVDLPDNSVDGIITSPPYSIALDYVQNDEHSLSDLGFNVSELRENFIGVRGNGKNKLNLYNEDMEKTYNEIYRVLKPGKFAVIVIGNATYQGNEVKTVEFTIEYMKKLGFSLENNINKIIFGLYNVMKKEHILIFKKDGSL
ncbi:MAG TPA: DNA methyltransferase [Candidatus Kapabacteria bacterium]|nr:DNA methyltransferase [Candidatus Kapabacteria bacterium]